MSAALLLATCCLTPGIALWKNLKTIRCYGWQWLCRVERNRSVNPDKKGNVAIEEVEIPAEGRVVHLKGYGMVKVFRTEAKNGAARYWATNDLGMSPKKREELELAGWGIETYHQGLKQCCGIEQAKGPKRRGAEEAFGVVT